MDKREARTTIRLTTAERMVFDEELARYGLNSRGGPSEYLRGVFLLDALRTGGSVGIQSLRPWTWQHRREEIDACMHRTARATTNIAAGALSLPRDNDSVPPSVSYAPENVVPMDDEERMDARRALRVLIDAFGATASAAAVRAALADWTERAGRSQMASDAHKKIGMPRRRVAAKALGKSREEQTVKIRTRRPIA